jgi:hypothetical protein
MENGACQACSLQGFHCTRMVTLFTISDQEAQRKALGDLAEEALESADGRPQQQYRFGMLHLLKSLVGSCRQYFLTDAVDRFSIAMLAAVYTSNTQAGRRITGICASGVVNPKDRHNDYWYWQTCQPMLAEILSECGPIVVTRIPEQYK